MKAAKKIMKCYICTRYFSMLKCHTQSHFNFKALKFTVDLGANTINFGKRGPTRTILFLKLKDTMSLFFVSNHLYFSDCVGVAVETEVHKMNNHLARRGGGKKKRHQVIYINGTLPCKITSKIQYL